MKEDSINDLMELSMGLSMATVFARAMGNMMEHSMAQVERANAPLGDPSLLQGRFQRRRIFMRLWMDANKDRSR